MNITTHNLLVELVGLLIFVLHVSVLGPHTQPFGVFLLRVLAFSESRRYLLTQGDKLFYTDFDIVNSWMNSIHGCFCSHAT